MPDAVPTDGFEAWWRSRVQPPSPNAAQMRRAAREAFAAGAAAERERASHEARLECDSQSGVTADAD